MKTAIESIKAGRESNLKFIASSPTFRLLANADRFTLNNRKDRSGDLLAIVHGDGSIII